MGPYPYPLADWRDAAAYPRALADLPPMAWAWEFLRRNPDYQAGFDRFTPLVLNAEKGAADALCERFRVQPAPPDPRGPFPEWAVFSDAWGADAVPPWFVDLTGEDSAAERERHGAERERVAVVFDLRSPLETQLERARRELLDLRDGLRQGPLSDVFPFEPKRPRRIPRGDELPRYLRLLDGDAAGATLAELAAVLLPDTPDDYPDRAATKAARAALKAARALRDGGYFELLL